MANYQVCAMRWLEMLSPEICGTAEVSGFLLCLVLYFVLVRGRSIRGRVTFETSN